MKTYARYDDSDPALAEFAKLFAKYKKGTLTSKEWDKWNTVIKIKAHSGFVGSGNWMYQYKGKTFEIDGHANGRGFWGTNYSINQVK